MDKTVGKYLIRLQGKMFLGLSAFIFAFVFLFTFVDAMRRVPNNVNFPILVGGAISLIKTPIVFCELFVYVYFISAVTVLWSLANSHQITVLKSIGKSPNQILYPFLNVGAVIGTLFVFAVHPSCMYLSKHVKQIEHLMIAEENEIRYNVWLSKKQSNEVFYIDNFSGDVLKNVFIFKNGETVFSKEVKVDSVRDKWLLKDGYVSGDKLELFSEKEIENLISIDDIRKFSVPSDKSGIYEIVDRLFDENFYVVDLDKYVIQLNKILSNGIMLFIFAMISAILCLPLNRYKTKTFMSLGVILTSVGTRLIMNLCENVGNAGIMSPLVCIWTPILVFFLLSLSVLIWKEA